MTLRVPQCIFCQHYRRNGERSTCAAFPEGIPAPILDAEADHRYPYPGDRGIRFARRPDVDPGLWRMTRDVDIPVG